MKVPNYDKARHDKKSDKRKYNEFIGEDFRLLMSGKSGCGKTNTLMHMLRKPLIYFDKIYIYTPNAHQEKIIDLAELMDKISEKVGYPVMEIMDADYIKDTNEYPSDTNRKVVIFDDLMNANDKIQKKIANHFTDGRHHNISPIYLSQSYFDIPKKIRTNCTNMVLYNPTTERDLSEISRDNRIDKLLFDKLSEYEFIYLNKLNKITCKNFDESL